MPMLKDPSQKYELFNGPDLSQRAWPSKQLQKAPRWLATDLRDGNQSLASPMTISQKWKYFKMLVELGYKEIEISIPGSSETEFEFTRQVVENPDAVPDDVWVQVLCPCRLDLIDVTVKSLTGAKNVIISLYYAASSTFLETVFQMSQQDVYDKVVEAVQYLKSRTKDDPAQQRTNWNLMFSPEAFSDSDLPYCLRLCEAAKAIWQPSVEVPIILNLPATVETSTPNVYADQVEIFSNSISEREKVCVSLHPHNDRGCAIAAAELGQMAGAERVEGCLFGNGERAGNVDLVTLALNLYSQGVSPKVDFSNLVAVRAIVEECTSIQVHPRTPYAGELVFTAYSGAHQDAINKGLAKLRDRPDNKQQQRWKVPYLAMDPYDLGRNYEAIIRMNSQSGKGGLAWTLERQLALKLPKDLQIEFSKDVKRASETVGGVLSPEEITSLFLERYRISVPDDRILLANVSQVDEKQTLTYVMNLRIRTCGQEQTLRGRGATVLNALQDSLKPTPVNDASFCISRQTMLNDDGATSTILVAECRLKDRPRAFWGLRKVDGGSEAELMAALSATLDALETIQAGHKSSKRDYKIGSTCNGAG